MEVSDLPGEPRVGVVESVEVLRPGGEVVVAVGVEEHRQVVRGGPLVDLDQAIREALDRLLVASLDGVELRLGGGELAGQLARAVGRPLDLSGQLHLPGARLPRPLLEVGDLDGLGVHPLLELLGVGLRRVDPGVEGGIRGSGKSGAGDRRERQEGERHEGEPTSPEAGLSPHPPVGPPVPRL